MFNRKKKKEEKHRQIQVEKWLAGLHSGPRFAVRQACWPPQDTDASVAAIYAHYFVLLGGSFLGLHFTSALCMCVCSHFPSPIEFYTRKKRHNVNKKFILETCHCSLLPCASGHY